MGKFDGVLIASDFDNTMVYTEGALRSGGPVPAISRENWDAIGYFMAQGGTFSVATGRALPSFASVMDGVPMNGPTVLFNGAAIYDFAGGAVSAHRLSAGVHPGSCAAAVPADAGPDLRDLSRRQLHPCGESQRDHRPPSAPDPHPLPADRQPGPGPVAYLQAAVRGGAPAAAAAARRPSGPRTGAGNTRWWPPP